MAQNAKIIEIFLILKKKKTHKSLPEGSFDITASKQGFRDLIQTGIEIDDAEGNEVVSPAVWKCTYTLSIRRRGFESYTDSELAVIEFVVGYTAKLVISLVS